jgi:hypothetical protein
MTDQSLDGWEICSCINEIADVEKAEIVGAEISKSSTFP